MSAWRYGALVFLALVSGCGDSSHDGDGTSGTGGGAGTSSGASGSAGQAPNVGGGAGKATGGSSGSGLGGTAGGGTGGRASGAGGTSAAGGAVDQATAEYRSCAAYVEARCQRVAECGSSSAGSCVESQMPLCPDWVFGPGSNTTPEFMQQCVTDWMVAPCSVFQTYTTVCDYPPGDFAVGEPCVTDAQCQSKMCSGSLDRCGSCQAVLEPGASCGAVPAQCPYGTTCLGTTCSPRPGSALPPGSACDAAYVSCRTDYVCRDDGTGKTTCQPPLPVGSTCNDRECEPYSYCHPDTGVCTASPPAGMPCGESGIGACDALSFCDRSQEPPLCVARVGLGETCFDDPDVTDIHGNCTGALLCICDAGEDCTDGTCMQQALEGEACGGTSLCVAGTECRGGTCQIAGLQGAYAELCMP